MTKWDLIKDYVNSHDIITRKELKISNLGGNTVDNYINLLRNTQFLTRIGRGKYKRIIKIPNSLSSSKLSKIAYNYELRDKLMKSLIRKQKLDDINNS